MVSNIFKQVIGNIKGLRCAFKGLFDMITNQNERPNIHILPKTLTNYTCNKCGCR